MRKIAKIVVSKGNQSVKSVNVLAVSGHSGRHDGLVIVVAVSI